MKHILLSLLCCLPLMAQAYDIKIDGICYDIIAPTLVEVTYEKMGEASYSGDVVIPAYIMHNGEEHQVLYIGEDAFAHCQELTSVTLPASIQVIKEQAFYYCTALTSVIIPDAVRAIGDKAFMNCSSLTSISMPESLYSIGMSAFEGCKSLTSVKIPGAAREIKADTFYGCENLRSVTLPPSIESIGTRAFCNCSSLTSATLSSSLTYLGDLAFGYCSELTSVGLPASVTEIGSAFMYCSRLTDVCSLRMTPPTTDQYAFEETKAFKCILHVPAGAKAAYKADSRWNIFKDIVEDGELMTAKMENVNQQSQIDELRTEKVALEKRVAALEKAMKAGAPLDSAIEALADRISVLENRPLGDMDNDGQVTVTDVTKVVEQAIKQK